MEQRQDSIETEVRTLSATVQRVEQNQSHAVELNKLRFDSLDTGLKSLGGQMTDFIKRIEGILSGEVETIQSKQGQAIISDYNSWRKGVDADIAELKDNRDNDKARSEGLKDALYFARAALMLAGALAGPIIAITAILKP